MTERERVLVIDENDDTRELLTRLIERDFPEVEVVSFAWPSVALEFASRNRVRLAVTNAHMAVVRSGEFARVLRGKAEGAAVIVIGAEADAGDRATGMGADRFLVEGRLTFELADCVRGLLRAP